MSGALKLLVLSQFANDDDYRNAEQAVQRVVTNAVPVLESITVNGRSRKDNLTVARILSALEQTSLPFDKRVIASNLKKIEISHGRIGVRMIGRGAKGGLFPNVEVLKIARCHANLRHVGDIAMAVAWGKLPMLRKINWDGLAAGDTEASRFILYAFSYGQCPEMESISFMDNIGFDQDLTNLRRGLKACAKLREIRFDATMHPWKQLNMLRTMLNEDDLPRLEILEIRVPDELTSDEEVRNSKEAMKMIKLAASSRSASSKFQFVTRFGRPTRNSILFPLADVPEVED